MLVSCACPPVCVLLFSPEVDILGKYVSRMMNAIKDDKRLQLL